MGKLYWMHLTSSVKQSWMSNKEIISGLLMTVLMIFLLPLRWFGAALIAALIHELGHYTSVLLFGGTVHRLKFGLGGAVMEASGLNPFSDLFCLLAGPLAGLLPILMFRYMPAIAICGLIQSVFNLLPIYPLDGGRILKHIILMTGGSNHLHNIIENCFLILLFLLCFYIRFRFGLSLFLIPGFLLLRKTPCKPRKDWI